MPRAVGIDHLVLSVGGGGAVVQPTMLRRESTATSASAIFFIGGSPYEWRDLISGTAPFSSAGKPHSRLFASRRAGTFICRKRISLIFASLFAL